ncbi:LysR family transcriptional regulator [Cedecea davisae]|uniref:LysR family transcriptional regulator n=1 Tax=Cedecea davisae TaxID=158484 RepID=UPI001D0AB19C|nr:LysR family transcriptional regulator [Cedecea davisae]
MVRHAGAKNGLSPSGIDLNGLRIFVAIAETGSFVAGGKAMGLTRSAAGKALARLEAQLETRLLHRTTRSISLTGDGYGFYERCVQILQDLAEAEANVRQNFISPGGTLRLSVPETWGKVVMLPFLKQVLVAWPQLNVEINFTDRVVDLVSEGFDLGIRLGGLPKDSQLIARPLQHIRPHLYASPDYLRAAGTPESIGDLAHHQRLLYGLSPQSTRWELLNAAGEKSSFDGHSRIRFDSGEAVRAAAVEGLGIAYLPAFLVAPYLAEGSLIELLPGYSGQALTVHAVYPNRKHLAARVRLFIDRLIEYLGKQP